ncbi:MAG TPA: hypothetical protein VII75_08830 [Thermoanaerobaculia bacterium]|nr:hypothetical protein [Thermoanaerobaculia bacterium]
MKFVDDLRDRRGEVRKPDNTPLEIAASLVPAVAASVLPLYGPVASALRHIPLFARLLHLAIPVVLITLAVHAVMARSPLPKPPGIAHQDEPQKFAYVYKRGTRSVAKLLLIPLMLLLAFECYDKLPNWMFGRTSVAGYLCDARDRKPVDTVAEISDSLGARTSTTLRTDSTGYVSMSLSRWGQRPVSMKLSGGCEAVDLTAASPKTTAGCPATDPRDLPPRPARPFWSVTCASKK